MTPCARLCQRERQLKQATAALLHVDDYHSPYYKVLRV
jgi:hypothetical protein